MYNIKFEEKLEKNKSKLRHKIQSMAWLLVVITIFGGIKYPILGYIVPLVMLTGLVGSIFHGRFVCGWLCPRGAFFDRIVSRISPHKKIPEFFRNYNFRWIVFAVLMGLMALQIAFDVSNPYHWGAVFVRICVITTLIALVVAIIYHPRTWCSFCPMGTLQSVIGGHKKPLKMREGCVKCRICEMECPINLQIIDHFKGGVYQSKDCLKCSVCIEACPKDVLYFNE
ncbi:MAG: 4Fe-4S binding protein [Pseudomonadota bacterium]